MEDHLWKSVLTILSLFFLGLGISWGSLLFWVWFLIGLTEVPDIKYMQHIWKNREKTAINTNKNVYKTLIVNKRILCKQLRKKASAFLQRPRDVKPTKSTLLVLFAVIVHK